MISGYKTPDRLGSSCLSLNVKLGSFFSFFLKNYVPRTILEVEMVLTGTAGSSALNVETSSLASLLLCLVIRACVRVCDFELTSTEHKLSVRARRCTRQVLCFYPIFFSFFFLLFVHAVEFEESN